MLQGSNRFERAKIYFNYAQQYFGPANRRRLGIKTQERWCQSRTPCSFAFTWGVFEKVEAAFSGSHRTPGATTGSRRSWTVIWGYRARPSEDRL